MPSYCYRVIIVSVLGIQYEAPVPLGQEAWTHDGAIAYVRTRSAPEGTKYLVERAIKSPRAIPRRLDWMPHRAYIVGPDGIVSRTDR